MKTLSLFLGALIAVAAQVGAQTRADLSQRYGDALSETYRVRPGIAVTVQYSSGGEACALLIQAEAPLVPMNDSELAAAPKGVPIDSRELSAVLMRIIPPDQFGALKSKAQLNSGCAAVETSQYENVGVSRSLNKCAEPGQSEEASIAVKLKRSTCDVVVPAARR